jgi:hypothetical protein
LGLINYQSNDTIQISSDIIGIIIKSKRDGEVISMIDSVDYKRVKPFRWFVCSGGYIRSTSLNCKETIFLHKLIMSFPEGMVVDHINGLKIDNRSTNLRICRQSQNCFNRSKSINKSSSHKGVYFHAANKKFMAAIGKGYRKLHIGSFENEIDAAMAYNEKAIELFGEFAKLNDVH